MTTLLQCCITIRVHEKCTHAYDVHLLLLILFSYDAVFDVNVICTITYAKLRHISHPGKDSFVTNDESR